MTQDPQTILITGAAGFIGAAVAENLVAAGHTVVGVDCFNDYYDPELKRARVARVRAAEGGAAFLLEEVDICDLPALSALFEQYQPTSVVHLAAQAGVRYSLENPHAYGQTNVVGHLNILECCRARLKDGGPTFQHLLYASSSSVYGGNDKVPFAETDPVDHPQSLYAATKRADELMSHTYGHLYGLPATGLRFFTVYGPWGRPDMSPMLFASAILEGRPLTVFNHGDLWRDFTYIDDIVGGVVRLLARPPEAAPYHDVFNIGNHQPVKLLDYIKTMEKVLGREAVLDLQPWPPTEVYQTYASTDKLRAATGWQPHTPLEDGLQKFAEWFVEWHGEKNAAA